jgi:hypothetical protein
LVEDAFTSMLEDGVPAQEALDAIAPDIQAILDETWATFEETGQ